MIDKELVASLKILRESASPMYVNLTGRRKEFTVINDVSMNSFVWVIDETIRRIEGEE